MNHTMIENKAVISKFSKHLQKNPLIGIILLFPLNVKYPPTTFYYGMKFHLI